MYELIDFGKKFGNLKEIMKDVNPKWVDITNETTRIKKAISDPSKIVYVKENITFDDVLQYTQGIYPYECMLMHATKYIDPASPMMTFAKRNIITELSRVDMAELVSVCARITSTITKNITLIFEENERVFHGKKIPEDLEYQLKLLSKLKGNLIHETIQLKKFVNEI